MSLTQSRLTATSFRFRSSASMTEIISAVADMGPDQRTHSPGWGSALDPNDPVEIFGGVPDVLAPKILEEGDANEALALRLYWWEYSETQRVALGLPDHAHEAHRLRAVDVVVVPSRIRGHLSVFAITRAGDLLDGRLIPAITELISTVDEEAAFLDGESDISVSDPDFYLWIIDMSRRATQIGAGYELDQIRVVESKDSSLRGTALSEGVDTSRFEMLTLVALVEATFGPAKLKVRDTRSLANYDFELTADGQLAVQTGETYIPDYVTRAENGFRAFFDVALSIVPALLTAYRLDASWQATGRADFIRFCKQQLSGPTITLKLPAANTAITAAFYQDLLGFEIPDPASSYLVHGSLRLDMVSPSGAMQPLSVEMSTIDAGAVFERLVSAGAPVTRLPTTGAAVRFQVNDPDANRLEFTSE